MPPRGLLGFIIESNLIEGIERPPTQREITAHEVFLARPSMDVIDLEGFVHAVQPGAVLRREVGMNVRVGRHHPPAGGPWIERSLVEILKGVAHGNTPYATHVAYETLHPFMDGNGRSGRALWAWQTARDGLSPWRRSFLHEWYYQSLDAAH